MDFLTYASTGTSCIQEEEAVIRKRVLQELGEWKPPQLTAKERTSLLAEKAEIQREIESLTTKIQERKQKEADKYSKTLR